MNSQFKKGEQVKYTGKGFLSYDSEDNKMIYLEKDKSSVFDIWVEYKGQRMLVRESEIVKPK